MQAPSPSGGGAWSASWVPHRPVPPPSPAPAYRVDMTENTDSPALRRLQPGDTAPEFTLQDQDGRPLSLRDSAGRSTVVYLYPAAATPGCTTQACDFRDSLSALTAAGYRVLGISPDPIGKIIRFAQQESLTFPLLSDEDHAVAEAYGAWGEKKNYGRTYEGLVRSTVVVGPDGRVTHAQYNVKATGHVARLRRTLGVED